MIFSYGIGMLAMSLQWVTLLFNYFVSVYLGNEMVLTVLEPYFRRKKKGILVQKHLLHFGN